MYPKEAALMARHEIPGALKAFESVDRSIVINFPEFPSKITYPEFWGFLDRVDGLLVNYWYNEYAHCCSCRIIPRGEFFRDPEKRKQISFKLDYYKDADLIEDLSSVDNVQGLLKRLLRDHFAALKMEVENECDC